MTPKEKAQELIDNYLAELAIMANVRLRTPLAKQCALIAVDEIIDLLEDALLEWHVLNTDEILQYWQRVKEEIEKIK